MVSGLTKEGKYHHCPWLIGNMKLDKMRSSGKLKGDINHGLKCEGDHSDQHTWSLTMSNLGQEGPSNPCPC